MILNELLGQCERYPYINVLLNQPANIIASAKKNQVMKRVPKLIKMTVIASRQRHGDVTKVAENMNYSVSHCSRVIRGERNNDSILSEAYRITRRRVKNSELA